MNEARKAQEIKLDKKSEKNILNSLSPFKE
jgi:hypothetical protein